LTLSFFSTGQSYGFLFSRLIILKMYAMVFNKFVFLEEELNEEAA
jgi:hypothetical protein